MNRSANLAEEFAKLGPWIYQFQIDGNIYGGGISAVGDVRVERFLRFAPEAKTILELGSLEGAQTFILARQPGVKRVVALEGRGRICGRRDSSRSSSKFAMSNFSRQTSSRAT